MSATGSTQQGGSTGSAVIGFVVIGFFWLFVLGAFTYGIGGTPVAALWVTCAALHWVIVAVRIGSGRRRSSGKEIGHWWLWTLVAPIGLLYTVLADREVDAAGRPARSERMAVPAAKAPRPAAARTERSIEPSTRIARADRDRIQSALQALAQDAHQVATNATALSDRLYRGIDRVDLHRRTALLDGDLERLQDRSRRLLELEETAFRRPAPVVEPRPVKPAPSAAAAVPEPPAPIRAPQPRRAVQQEPRPAQPRPSRPPGPSLRERAEAAGLLGARGLALAGGIVTLLGVVFLVSLAANRGWIGAQARVATAGCISAIAFAAGIWMRRRFGQLHAAVATVGAGIAGGYATLLAAGALYDMVPLWLGLLVAALIAAAGASVAIRWSSETVAVLGLAGAIAVPGLAAFGVGLSVAGTAFVAVVLAVALWLAIWRQWQLLLLTSVAASLPQLFAIVGWPPTGTSGQVMVLAAVFSALYLATGLLLQLRAASVRLDPLASSFLIGPAALAGWSASKLVDGQILGADGLGIVLLAIALVYATLCGLFFRRQRELSIVLAAIAITVATIAFAQLTGGATLAIVWAVEGAALAWLAVRIGEARFQLGAIASLGLAVVHVLAYETPPRRLFVESAHPADGVLALLVVAGAVTAFAVATRYWPPARDEEERRLLGRIVHELRGVLPLIRRCALALAAVLALDAASLAVLELAQRVGSGSVLDRFMAGRVGVSVLWALVGTVLVVAGAAGRRFGVWVGGLVVLAVTVVDLVAFEQGKLSSGQWALTASLIAACLLVAGLGDGVQASVDPSPVSVVAVLASATLAGSAAGVYLDGRVQGVALLAVAGLFGLLAVPVQGWLVRRNLASVLWLVALVLALAAAPLLVLGSGLVAAFAVGACALAAVGLWVREPRLQAAALAPLAGAVGYTLSVVATPRQLFVETSTPGAGAGALLLSAAACALCAWLAQPAGPQLPDRFDLLLDRLRPGYRLAAGWLAAVLALDAASLAVLELAQRVGSGSVLDRFMAGRVGVSVLWALVGTVLVVAGAAGRRFGVWVGGLVVFAVTVVDLVAFEQGKLSSGQWALTASLIAACLLVAGLGDGVQASVDPSPVSVVAVLASATLAGSAAGVYLDGRVQGVALLAVAGLFGLLAVPVQGWLLRRNLASVLWLVALVLALAAAPLLVLGSGLVAAFAVGACALAAVGLWVREPRLQAAALAPLAGAVGYTLSVVATPRQLFVETSTPGAGAGALLLSAAACALCAWLAQPAGPQLPDRFDLLLDRLRPGYRLAAGWLAAVLALDAASLAVLELAQRVGSGSVLDRFMAGRVGVSVLWALVGTVLVVAGAAGRRFSVWVGGLVVFAVTVVDLVAFEQGKLSSGQWALTASLIAACLLVAAVPVQGLVAAAESGFGVVVGGVGVGVGGGAVVGAG